MDSLKLTASPFSCIVDSMNCSSDALRVDLFLNILFAYFTFPFLLVLLHKREVGVDELHASFQHREPQPLTKDLKFDNIIIMIQ